MPKLSCTEPVCRHEWTEPADPRVPRCPRCGGFWVRVTPDERPVAGRRRARLLVRRAAVAR